MAGVVKWLRPRIVVPICMGSNPISRPIIKKLQFGVFFVLKEDGDENPSVRYKANRRNKVRTSEPVCEGVAVEIPSPAP